MRDGEAEIRLDEKVDSGVGINPSNITGRDNPNAKINLCQL